MVAALPGDDFLHQAHLIHVGQIAAVNRVGLEIQRLPMVQAGGHEAVQMLNGHAREPGVGAEHRRGQRHGLNAHGRQGRNHQRQGAAPHAGQIMHRDDALRGTRGFGMVRHQFTHDLFPFMSPTNAFILSMASITLSVAVA